MPESPVAIVTGASSGIGRAAASLLAKAGYHLVLLARREAKLREVEQAITDETPDITVSVLPTDVTDADAVNQAVETAFERFGRIDAVVNAAGDAPLMPIEQITPDIWRQCIDSNLSSVVYMTRAVWPTLQRQKRGMIVNVSSMASVDPFRGFAMYAAAKVGVNMFTHCCAEEGKRRNIRAAAVAPGAVETPMLRQNFPEKTLPADRALAPEDVAQVIVDCITDEREFTSGETIQVPSP